MGKKTPGGKSGILCLCPIKEKEKKVVIVYGTFYIFFFFFFFKRGARRRGKKKKEESATFHGKALHYSKLAYKISEEKRGSVALESSHRKDLYPLRHC